MHRRSSFIFTVALFCTSLLLASSFFFSTPTEAATCTNLTRTLYRGASNASTGGQVSQLQQFLKDRGYFAFSVSGYFGLATEGALKQFQRRYGIVSSGNAATTGYGATGALTRAKIRSLSGCGTAATATPRPAAPSPIAQNTQTPPASSGNTLPAGVSISCSPSATLIGLNSTITWNSTVSGLTNPTYAWEGTDGLLGNFASVDKTYTLYGTKKADLTINNRYTVHCTSLLVTTDLPQYSQQQPNNNTNPPPGGTTPPPPAGTTWPVAGLNTSPIFAFGVDNQQYTYLGKWYWLVDGNSMRNMPEALALVNQMPVGRRAFSSLNAHNIMNTHPSDRCQIPNGSNPPTYTSYQCPWYDNGAAEVRQKFSDFATAFKQAGGQIDYLILDSEQAFPNWVVNSTAHASAIENDPRFPSLLSQLQNMGGFPGNTATIVSDTIAAAHWGPYANPSSAQDNYLKWNALAETRFAGYVNSSIFNPIQAQFPSLKGSDYELFYHSPSYSIPDGNGHRVHDYGTGAIVGTHQARALYGTLNEISSSPSKSPLPGFLYEATPFNAFKYDTNGLRATRLSSSAPLSPWFSVKSWQGEPAAGFPTQYTNNDYYTENILHAGLITKDPDFFILWNRGAVGTAADDLFFEQTLEEFNTAAGYAGRQPILSGLVPWDANFVYTGSQVGNYKVWRFTPKLASGQTITQVTTSSGKSDWTQPVVFTVGGQTITFPNAFVYKPTNPVSNAGAWVIQKSSAGGPQVAITTGTGRYLAAAYFSFASTFETIIQWLRNFLYK